MVASSESKSFMMVPTALMPILGIHLALIRLRTLLYLSAGLCTMLYLSIGLTQCCLGSLPDSLGGLEALFRLDLSNNKLTGA